MKAVTPAKAGCIYVLRDPRTNAIRYCGKTGVQTQARFKTHISHARTGFDKSHKANWIKQLLKLGFEPVLEVIFTWTADEVDPDAWKGFERHWIAELRRLGHDLTNHTEGGDGLSGAVLTAIHKERIAASKRGKPRSAETKAKVSAAKRGKKLAREHIEKLRQAGFLRTQTEEARAKIGLANRGGSGKTNEKLTEAIVLSIRGRYAEGETLEVLAADTGIAFQTVSKIVRGRAWVHVGGPITTAARTKNGVKGSKNHNAKVTEEIVHAIRWMAAEGISHRIIADQHKLSPGHVGDIVQGKRWAHIELLPPPTVPAPRITRVRKGAESPNTNLTDDMVREIRHRAAQGEKGRALAKAFSTSNATISRIVNRVAWGHIP